MYGAELAAGGGMHVHRSVKTRLEARGVRLSHPLSRGDEDTHVYIDDDAPGGGGSTSGHGRKGKRVEVYVPQLRPAVPREGEKDEDRPRRLEHREWNVEEPEWWRWVD